MLTDKELSVLMHSFVEMHNSSEKIIEIMKDKEWMDSDCAEDVNPSDEFERDVWAWIFQELKERGVAAIE